MDLPDDIAELCIWYAREGHELSSAIYKAKRRVEEYVRDHTVVTTPYGTLEAQSAGWDWDDADVAAVVPDLVTGMAVRFVGTREECERIMSLVLEEIPGVEWGVTRTIDKRRANRLANAGGDVGDKLRAARIQKPPRIVVK